MAKSMTKDAAITELESLMEKRKRRSTEDRAIDAAYITELRTYAPLFSEISIRSLMTLFCLEIFVGRTKLTCEEAGRLTEGTPAVLEAIRTAVERHDLEHLKEILGDEE